MVLLWNETQQWSCPVSFTVPPEALVADLSVLVIGGWPSSIHRVWEITVMSEAVSGCKRAGWPLIGVRILFTPIFHSLENRLSANVVKATCAGSFKRKADANTNSKGVISTTSLFYNENGITSDHWASALLCLPSFLLVFFIYIFLFTNDLCVLSMFSLPPLTLHPLYFLLCLPLLFTLVILAPL